MDFSKICIIKSTAADPLRSPRFITLNFKFDYNFQLKNPFEELHYFRHSLFHCPFEHQVMLDHQQFDMIVRLMNAALQDDSDMDEFGIAATILPLSTVFGRKLAKGITQFAYTLIQDHAVWQNQQFWEASFYNDVQTGIKAVYLAMHDQVKSDKCEELLWTSCQTNLVVSVHLMRT